MYMLFRKQGEPSKRDLSLLIRGPHLYAICTWQNPDLAVTFKTTQFTTLKRKIVKRISLTVTGFRLLSDIIDPSDDFLCFLFSDCDSSHMSNKIK